MKRKTLLLFSVIFISSVLKLTDTYCQAKQKSTAPVKIESANDSSSKTKEPVVETPPPPKRGRPTKTTTKKKPTLAEKIAEAERKLSGICAETAPQTKVGKKVEVPTIDIENLGKTTGKGIKGRGENDHNKFTPALFGIFAIFKLIELAYKKYKIRKKNL